MAHVNSQVKRRSFVKTVGGVATAGAVGLAGCSGDGDGGDGDGGDGGSDGGDGGSDGEGTTSSGSGGGSAEAETVVHGAVQGGTTGVLVTAMTDQGYDAEYGIDVQPEYFTNPPTVQQQIVLNEDIPTGFMGSIVATRLNAQGHRPRLVGPYMLYHMYVLTRSDTDIQGPEDFAGKSVTWSSRAADAWLKFLVILEMDTGTPPEEVQFQQTAPPASISLLEQGEVDLILLNEPLVTKALANFDFEVVYSPREVWLAQQDLPLTTVDLAWDGNWYEDGNQDAGAALAKASRDTQEYLQGNMDAAVDNYTDAFGLENQAQIDLAKERMTEVYPTEWNEQDFKDSGYDMAVRANELGLIDQEPTRDIFSWVL